MIEREWSFEEYGSFIQFKYNSGMIYCKKYIYVSRDTPGTNDIYDYGHMTKWFWWIPTANSK